MSISAEVVVLIDDNSPSGNRVEFGMHGFSMIEDADLHCWISPNGEFEYQFETRPCPLLGEPSLEGRLWKAVLGRYWSPDNTFRSYGGNPVHYAHTIGVLLNQPGILRVWYGVLTQDGGCKDIQAATDEWINSFFGEQSSH